MKKELTIFVLAMMVLTSCKGKEPEKSDFEKYNNPNFKLSDYPKIQGVYTMTPDDFLQALGVNVSFGEVCAEFVPAKNTLKMRSGLEGKDQEIQIINVIGDEMYFSENGKVLKAKLIYNDSGKLRKFEVYKLNESDPRKALDWGQGPKGNYEECLKRKDEIMENNRQEAEQLKGMEAM
ncbi:hypothetical protein DLM76_18250 [Leptospira yasudae]|uniref:hypothetical protein n=1 Tax=Leptospira yasudae TaxID=2202201 RepID=UPI000E59A11C|nr:hypothetical protein [Leptospira yasudae]RHX91110.1 hypothetical protein DLM76_18250 [Leptospira yasudae]